MKKTKVYTSYDDMFLCELKKAMRKEAEFDRTGVGRIFLDPVRIIIQPWQIPTCASRRISDFWAHEYKWFVIEGSDNIKHLVPKYQKIWEPWSDDDGSIGEHSYPNCFKHLIRLVSYLTKDIQSGVMSTQRALTTWSNDIEGLNIDTMIKKYFVLDKGPYLPCCHGSFIHFKFDKKTRRLNLYTLQRSGDIPLGVPHNLMFYKTLLIDVVAMINMKLCNQSNYDLVSIGELDYNISFPHFYLNQMKIAFEQMNEIKRIAGNRCVATTFNSVRAIGIRDLTPKYDSDTVLGERDPIPLYGREEFNLSSKSIKYPSAAV